MLILLTLSALPLVYTDFKYRYVHLWGIISFLIASLGYFFLERPVSILELGLSYGTIAFVSLLALGITYFKLKKRYALKEIAGCGDLLFFVATPLILPLESLLVFLILACTAGIAHYLLVHWLYSRTITIPLAGWGALLLICFLHIRHLW